MDRFDDAQEDPPKKEGILERLSKRFFPPTVLGDALKEKTKKRRPTPPAGRRRPKGAAPIDRMDGDKKKAKGSEGYYDAAGTR